MSRTRGLIRHPADRFQLALAVVGPVVLISPFLLSLNVGLEIALWIFVWLCISRHNYILHNHVHHPFTSSTPLNRTINVLLGFCTGMTAGIWKITHVHGHHVEDRLHFLPSRGYVRLLKIDENAKFSYFSAINHALKTAPLQWLIPVYVLIQGSLCRRTFRRKFYRYYLLEFLFVYALVLGLFLIQPAKAFFYFGIMYSLVYLVSRHVDYVTHVSNHRDSNYGFANVCLHPQYNKLLWNFGFHIAHHLQPRAHWTALPSIYGQLGVDEATEVARTVNYFGFFRPAAFRWRRVRESGAK
jgi:fatty acid desaturase